MSLLGPVELMRAFVSEMIFAVKCETIVTSLCYAERKLFKVLHKHLLQDYTR